MRSLKTTFTIIMCACSVALFAQNVKNKSAKFDEFIYPRMPVAGIQKVKIEVYPGPGMDMSQNDLYEKKGLGEKLQAKQDQINGIGHNWVTFQPFDLSAKNQDATVEIAFGDFQQLEKQLREHKIVCVRDDGKLDKEDIKECPGYYYDINYRFPVVVKITDASGNVLNAEHFDTQATATFGYDDSGLTGYIKTSDLDAAYNKAGSSNSIKKNAIQDRLDIVGEFLQENFYFRQEKVNVDISSGGGKLNYDDLDQAQSLTLEALENLQGSTSEEMIRKAIAIWDKALENADMNDKKARINRKIAGFLALNKAKVYYYIQDYDNALASAKEAGKYLKFSSNTAHMESVESWEQHIINAKANKLAIEKNKLLVTGVPNQAPPLIELIKVKEKNAPYAIIKPEQKYNSLKNDYLMFNSAKGGNNPEDQTKGNAEMDLAAMLLGGGVTESGDIDWEQRMQHVSNMGYYINIAYSKNETIPTGICELEPLNTLLANNAQITSIPSEIGQLKNLKTLNLAANNLANLPEEIGNLENLMKLNLANNMLSSLPAEVGELKNLKTLNLKGNNIPQSDIDAIQAKLPNCKIKI